MRSEIIKNKNVGPPRSLTLAPLVGVGTDFKTPPSWGGSAKDPPGPNGDGGVVVYKYKRIVAYRTTSFDGMVRLVAVLLHRVAVSSRGSVCYLNGRRMRMLLSLSGTIHPIDLSVIYSLMEKLGFDVVKQSRGKYVVIRMDNPIMREVKSARSFDEILEIVKKHLSNGEPP
jgi:hypothetical protein